MSTMQPPWMKALSARWAALAARERLLSLLAAAALGLTLLWTLALNPALQTLRSAPAQLDALDAQLQTMQRLAAESRELRGIARLDPAQAAAALKNSSERLGDKLKINLQGDRAVVTVNGITPTTLREWLSEARATARARVVEATLTRGTQGYNGTLVLALGTAP